ncbi:MAG: glycosyltransferase family 39 protein [Burkholderiales bacterium]
MREVYRSKTFVWILLVIFLAVWFYALGARTLVPSDEGRYAEMAREMAATGDWITPRLNALKYFEKPPLQTWMNALTFKLFGLGEWQARLWSGLCGLFGIALVTYTGRRVFSPWAGATAGLVLASSFWWAGLSHVNVLDMGLSGMMTLALCGMLLAQHNAASTGERQNWMLACWAGMALAFLSKGPIGIILPGGVLALYTLMSRDWSIWKRLYPVRGLVIFTLIAAPWFVLVWLKNPEHPHFFFIHENWERFFSKVHHREGPIYYFVPFLIAGAVPWTGILAQSIWAGRRDVGNGFRPKIMLLIWTVFIFCFFSISSSVLPHYILPIFPALALLIANFLETAKARSWMLAAGFLAAIAVAGLASVPYLPRISVEPNEAASYRAAQPWVVAGCSIMLAGAACVFWWVRQKRADLRTLAAIALAVSGFLGGQLLMLGTEQFGRYRAGLLLVPAIEAELTPATVIYTVGTYEQSLPFYLRRTMTTVGETNDELDFGLKQEPNLGIPTREEFIVRWRTGQKALAIMRPETYADFQKRGVPMRVVARDARRVVVANDVKQ